MDKDMTVTPDSQKKPSMKIAVCLFKYFPYGGLQRDFMQISKELLDRGHKVTVYTGAWDGEKPDYLDIHILPTSGFSNHAKNRSFHKQFQQAIAGSPVDLVFGFNKMPGLDVYFGADTCFATKAYEDKNWLYRLTARCKWSLIYEEAVVSPSVNTEVLILSAVEGKAFQRYYNTPEERLHLIPPGIKRDRIRHQDSDKEAAIIRQELNINANDKVIAFLGSDYKRKGLDRLLKSVASLPDTEREIVKVLVIGRDKHLPDFEKLARQLGVADNIIFVGQRDDVPQLLFASNYLVHPAYLENSGNAIIEALVAGLPVLCTEKCGNSTYIKNYDLGWVIPEPFNQTEMDDLVLTMLHSDVDWRQRCAEFASTADVYSSPVRIAELIERVGARQ